ncbi:hypothetical protein GGI59_001298 [Rhizobium lentis]|uniref:Uncharacterized protein n=1 Tax=Rhizobium lentis TaxID=1138194 RepID=A0A7W8XC21_9HYPH|nr:hypothetical protein [Rhizobium lentis]MBB5549122.1 hypothetical protein [Rhizobium lentis]MBB5559655.1 hypothetical protein [Rhizobium lentis]MBB5566461.1 hypothetical protein [Rhizobium lentis]
MRLLPKVAACVKASGTLLPANTISPNLKGLAV